MADGVSHAEKLALIIRKERLAEIEEEYYERVDEDTYNRWYKQGKKPYLRADLHGGFTRWEYVDGYQEKHYYMLRRKYRFYTKRWRGRHPIRGDRAYVYTPNRAKMKKIYKEAEQLRIGVEEKAIKISRGTTFVTVTIPYKEPLTEYRHSELFAAFINDGTKSEYRQIRKNGKMNKADRFILKAIDIWAKKNGISCLIYGTGDED